MEAELKAVEELAGQVPFTLISLENGELFIPSSGGMGHGFADPYTATLLELLDTAVTIRERLARAQTLPDGPPALAEAATSQLQHRRKMRLTWRQRVMGASQTSETSDSNAGGPPEPPAHSDAEGRNEGSIYLSGRPRPQGSFGNSRAG